MTVLTLTPQISCSYSYWPTNVSLLHLICQRTSPDCHNASSTCQEWHNQFYLTALLKSWHKSFLLHTLRASFSDLNWSISGSRVNQRQLWQISEQPALVSWWIHQFIHQSIMVNLMCPSVLSLLMLSGTESWRIDRHTLPVSALCKGSCNCNELQSGLFGMLLIFDANIWGEQAFWRTEIWQPKFLPLPVWSYPLTFLYSKTNFLPCCLALPLHISLSILTSLPSSLCLGCFHVPLCHSAFSVSLFVSLQHRVQQWLTLSNRLTLASNTTQVIRLSYPVYSLTSSICPFPLSPLPFCLSYQ